MRMGGVVFDVCWVFILEMKFTASVLMDLGT